MSQDDEDLSALMRQHATRHAAPDSLRARIRTQIALAEAGRTPAPTVAPTHAKAPRRPWLSFGWGPASVGFALGMLCMALVLPTVQHLAQNSALDEDLVADHVRALRSGPLIQVVSTDRHTVKPWFQGRLDYAPPVLDLASEGFPLMGGRVEQVRGNAVAALAYSRNQHVIDVFVWPSGARQAPMLSTRRGFNVLHWSDGAMQYWAVSDVDRSELEGFAGHWQQRTARP